MTSDVKNLEAYAIIGFDGTVLKGLRVHPSGDYIVYPMGNKVCIQDWKTKKMHFLSGHTNSVSTVAVSPKGTYVGSGQINHIGFKASAKLWDFKKRTLIGSHELHKVRVEACTFSADERYMITLGGRDDGCVVLWDCVANTATGTAAASRLTTGDAVTLCSLWQRTSAFITGGDSNLRVWNVRAATKNLDVVDVALGKLRRSVRCIAVAKDDSHGFAGTTTGDIIKFSLQSPDQGAAGDFTPSLIGCFGKCGPFHKGKKPETLCYSQGIESILIMDDGCLLVGAGDGTIDIIDQINWKGEFPKGRLADPNAPLYKALKSTKLDGSITSLELMESPKIPVKDRLLLVGTRTSEIYAVPLSTFTATLVLTCHTCAINDIAFPKSMSGVFATGGLGSLRVWALHSGQELLRICVPNAACSALLFSHDGHSIVSAWNDMCIRAFTPLTGRLMYCILNTHNKGTSALDMTTDGRTLISGGCEGQVRVWDITPTVQTLKKVLKEHKSPVSAIQVSPNDIEAVSAGTDGSCIIWDLVSLSRRQVLYANTLFLCVCYEPLGCQLLTGGTNRRVAYWETAAGSLARELEVSKTGAVNALHITGDGELFATGANDQMVKLWQYQSGIYTHVGLGHAGAVTCLRFSPDQRHLVSCCAAGGLIVWKMPEEYIRKPKPSVQELPPSAKSSTPEEKPSLNDELRLPLKEGKGGGRTSGPPTGSKPKVPAAPSKTKRLTHLKRSRKGGGRTSGPPTGSKPKVPAAPSKTKTEKIQSMDTARDSVRSECPCKELLKEKVASNRSSSKSTRRACMPDTCANLPTKTTSKEFVNRNGSGDKKK